MAQSDARRTGDPEVAGSIQPSLASFFRKVDHEIFSTVISSVSLIQEGQLSVSDERIRTSAGYNVTAWRTKPAQEKCV